MSEKITAWSFSRYNLYQQCPGKAKLMYIDKLKEPTSDAMLNGTKKHKELEDWLKGYAPLPSWMHPNLMEFCTRLLTLKPAAELEVAFNKNWQPVDWFAKDAWARIKIDALSRTGTHVEILDWKGLALDTLLPTPGGFKTMADIEIGDSVFDMYGKPCLVTHKSQVKQLPMYELQFKDGAKVTCDEEHLWQMYEGRVLDTLSLKTGMAIPLQKPVELPEADLPIHPYVLGYWLGNGRKRDGSLCAPNTEILDYISALGYEMGKNIGGKREKDIEVRTVHGLRGDLSSLGLLDNKHIPEIYLQGSVAQRLSLLQGLMDSDGHANNYREEAVFSNTNRRLLAEFRVLLSSLGIRFRSNTGMAKGFGLTIKATQIAFKMPVGMRAFAAGPKAARELTWTKFSQDFRTLKAITPLGVGLSQCIGVDSPTKTYLCTNRFLVTHNTGKVREGTYDEQLELYALTAMLMFPTAETFNTTLVFVDHGKTIQGDQFVKADKDMLLKRWMDRVDIMLNDTTFRYTPNQYCRNCWFRRANGTNTCDAA